jgi:superoxide reductase
VKHRLATTLLAAVTLLALATPPAHAQGQADQITPDFDAPKTGVDPKHTPKILAPDSVTAGQWFDVTIEVGEGAMHPSLAEHSVRYIALYFNDVEINRTYLHPVYSQPKVTYTIALKKSGTLKAVEAPNHTAEWSATKKIEVKAPAEQ